MPLLCEPKKQTVKATLSIRGTIGQRFPLETAEQSGFGVRCGNRVESRRRDRFAAREDVGRMTDEDEAEIFDRFRRGATADQLAQDYGRTKAAIARIVRDVRVKRLAEEPIDFVYSPEFESPGVEVEILGKPPQLHARKSAAAIRLPAGFPPYLASLYQTPLLSREQEAYYFRKMNYLKFRASQLRKQLDGRRPTVAQISRIETLLKQAEDVKQLLTRSNLRLVVSVAKRFCKPGTNLFELVSDGNLSLIRAIEKFDYSKGFKLSTYATWAILNHLRRSVPARHVELKRFRTSHDERLNDRLIDPRTNPFELERTNRVQRRALGVLLDRLDRRHRDIITWRYGLEEGTEPLTLDAVGRRFGVSKERIRQLEAKAIVKLRQFASEERLDIPGI
jgi:RNA polymerase sigma factor (sigma-70 family)